MKYRLANMALTEERFKELMELMTQKQNRDIEEKLVDKLDDVKKEMTGALKIVTERQDKMENEHQGMMEQMEEMKEQLKDIKKITETSQPSENNMNFAGAVQRPRQPLENREIDREDHQNMYPLGDGKESEKKKIEEVIDLARRTISLHPFTQSDIQSEINRGAQDEIEAKLWAIQTFLRYEMNIKSHVLATLQIENIFPPPGNNWDCINVTFSSITAVNTVFSYTMNMRKEVNVDIYVPPECYERYKTIRNVAYHERYPDNDGVKKNQTRIKWGSTDFILYRKALGTRFWSVVKIRKPLPPVDLNAVAVAATHLSPAPGRQSRDKNKRNRSNGSGSGSDIEKNLSKTRKVADNIDDDKAGTDTGRVVQEESYCPSSPAPAKKGTAAHMNSPIFTKNKNNTFSPIPSRMNPLVL